MLIESKIKGHLFFSGADDEVVGPRFDIIHYFQTVRLDFLCIRHIPHVKSWREYNDWAADPIMIDKEVSIWNTVDLQSILELKLRWLLLCIESFMLWGLHYVKLPLKFFPIKIRRIPSTWVDVLLLLMFLNSRKGSQEERLRFFLEQ